MYAFAVVLNYVAGAVGKHACSLLLLLDQEDSVVCAQLWPCWSQGGSVGVVYIYALLPLTLCVCGESHKLCMIQQADAHRSLSWRTFVNVISRAGVVGELLSPVCALQSPSGLSLISCSIAGLCGSCATLELEQSGGSPVASVGTSDSRVHAWCAAGRVVTLNLTY